MPHYPPHTCALLKTPRAVALQVNNPRSPRRLRIWAPLYSVDAPLLSTLAPGPPAWEAKLSRVLRAPSSAPNSAQAGVIDAERPRQERANGSSSRLRSKVIVPRPSNLPPRPNPKNPGSRHWPQINLRDPVTLP